MIVISGRTPDTMLPTVLFQNLLGMGTLEATVTLAGTYAENALGPQTNDWWGPAALPAALSVVLVAAAEADACAIISHTLGTAGATVYVERRSGAVWVTLASVAPADDGPLLLLFPPISATQWRVRITGTALPLLGVVIIGKRLIFPEGIRPPYVPVHLAQRVEVTPQVTIGGQFIGSLADRMGGDAQVTFCPLPRTWVDGAMRPFIRHFNDGQPFVWAGAPGLHPEDVAYCWRKGGELRPAWSAGSKWAEAVSMEFATHAA